MKVAFIANTKNPSKVHYCFATNVLAFSLLLNSVDSGFTHSFWVLAGDGSYASTHNDLRSASNRELKSRGLQGGKMAGL